MYWCSSSASARADARSWPNGFSTTTRAGLRQAGLGEPLDDRAEEERRDLEVEDRRLAPADRLADALVRRRVGEVARHVREPRGEAVEDLLVERLAGAHDRLARALDELVDRPVVDRDADDRAVEQPALLEPVERPEGHHLRQVAGDPEDDEDVGRRRLLAVQSARGAVMLPWRSSRPLPFRSSDARRAPARAPRSAGRRRRGRVRTRRSGPSAPGCRAARGGRCPSAAPDRRRGGRRAARGRASSAAAAAARPSTRPAGCTRSGTAPGTSSPSARSRRTPPAGARRRTRRRRGCPAAICAASSLKP